MRLTRATEYAFRALRFLASRTEERWFSIQEIAEAEQMPIQFLAKVMQHLTQAGMVHSACGKTGGYRLGKPAKDIRLAQVLLAMEGPLAVNNCLAYPGECGFEKVCRMHPVWEELQAAILGVMQKYDLSMVTSTDAAGIQTTRTRKTAVRKSPARKPAARKTPALKKAV